MLCFLGFIMFCVKYIIQSMMIPTVVIAYLVYMHELSPVYELICNYTHRNTGTMQLVKLAAKIVW